MKQKQIKEDKFIKISCKVIKFPIKKQGSIACCKTTNLDWNRWW